MTTFIENNFLYHKYQSGYRKNNSMTTLLLKMKDYIDKSVVKLRHQYLWAGSLKRTPKWTFYLSSMSIFSMKLKFSLRLDLS